jgi:hypothetical protein
MNRRNITGHRGRFACFLATAALTLCLVAGVNARTSFTTHSSDLAAHRTDLTMSVSTSDHDDYVELLAAAGIANLPTAR